MAVFSTPAFATCPTAPSNWNAGGCDSRCTTTSTTFSCDVSGAGGASSIIMVEDYSAGDEYEAWGNYNGDLFCCPSDPQYAPTIFLITGSAYADMLQFSNGATGTQLQPNTAAAITATINAGTGDDTIFGSNKVLDYSETLNGGTGDDVIFAGNDADVVNGNDGNDTIYAGPGSDTVDGGAGNDTITGGDGDDMIDGSGGIDFIGGGAGDDDIDGGDEGDVICGDGETAGDTLDAGDLVDESVPDQLYGANALDLLTCDTAGTSRDYSSIPGFGCVAGNPHLTAKPAQCP